MLPSVCPLEERQLLGSGAIRHPSSCGRGVIDHPIGHPGEHGLGEVVGEFLWGIHPALRRSQDLDRNRRNSPILQEPLWMNA